MFSKKHSTQPRYNGKSQLKQERSLVTKTLIIPFFLFVGDRTHGRSSSDSSSFKVTSDVCPLLKNKSTKNPINKCTLSITRFTQGYCSKISKPIQKISKEINIFSKTRNKIFSSCCGIVN